MYYYYRNNNVIEERNNAVYKESFHFYFNLKVWNRLSRNIKYDIAAVKIQPYSNK